MKQVINKTTRAFFFLMVMLLLTKTGYSQDPGGGPDGPPPAVPFEDYAHLILLAVGFIFSFFVMRRLRRNVAN